MKDYYHFLVVVDVWVQGLLMTIYHKQITAKCMNISLLITIRSIYIWKLEEAERKPPPRLSWLYISTEGGGDDVNCSFNIKTFSQCFHNEVLGIVSCHFLVIFCQTLPVFVCFPSWPVFDLLISVSKSVFSPHSLLVCLFFIRLFLLDPHQLSVLWISAVLH